MLLHVVKIVLLLYIRPISKKMFVFRNMKVKSKQTDGIIILITGSNSILHRLHETR